LGFADVVVQVGGERPRRNLQRGRASSACADRSLRRAPRTRYAGTLPSCRAESTEHASAAEGSRKPTCFVTAAGCGHPCRRRCAPPDPACHPVTSLLANTAAAIAAPTVA
jgi:hypothetical protein